MGAVTVFLLGLGYAGMLVAALTATLAWFLVSAAVSYGATVVLDHLVPRVAGWLNVRLQLGHGMQFVLREILVLVVAARTGQPSSVLTTLLVSYVALQLIRSGFSVVTSTVSRRRRLPVEWRNLDLPALELPAEPLPRLTRRGLRWIIYLDMLPLCGVVAVELGAPVTTLPAFAGAAVLLALALCAIVLLDRVRLLSRPGDKQVRRTVRDAVEESAPSVVAYFAGGPVVALDVWLPVLEQLGQPVVVYLRERSHLHCVASSGLPVVVLPRAVDLEYFRLPSLKLALYVTNDPRNNHLIRLTGMKDVFLGYGDSDKGSSFNPMSRIYDEVWVAGPAGRDRYRRADVGVRDEQVREVGRPQLAAIHGHAAVQRSERPCVLYAPTWEGADPTLEYSSLLVMGRSVVSALLAMDPPVRVLFRPHPHTGVHAPEYARARAEACAMAASTPGGHEVVETIEDLYAAFHRADVVITDISAVITDFLALDKPYIVTNPRGDDPDEFRQVFPSTRGAYLLGPGCSGLADLVADALGADSLAAQRRALARYLLGDLRADPIRRFGDAVSDLIAKQEAEDAETGFAPGWYDDEPVRSLT